MTNQEKSVKTTSEPWDNELQEQEYAELTARYLPEETTILVLTGSDFGGAAPIGRNKLLSSSILLNAWTVEGDSGIRRDEIWLDIKASSRMLESYIRAMPKNTILRCRVRPLANPGEWSMRFLLTEIPEPASHPKLEAIQKRRNKPVILQEEGLGSFTLNREDDWFQGDIHWLDCPVRLTFDREGSKKQKASLETARTLLADALDWDNRLWEYAAGKLMNSAMSWAENTGDPESVLRRHFMEDMKLESIQVDSRGCFEFWFDDGGMFGGHSVFVSGNLTDGPNQALIEG